ncbi:hypothetical protein RJ45_21930 [Photobacterium gaetbulicola]|uniref:Uncharacterized protein n=1 Tax=Photobacterium gaetbulicola TaxID=1295392 RepID=A0A0B9GS10_9GAMM|nr:hypothetical protein [Photobacterium gaetbulicola]KHT61576.1 hypothetical protein RJ45_21930 [Photobacterium gaetbulicola]
MLKLRNIHLIFVIVTVIFCLKVYQSTPIEPYFVILQMVVLLALFLWLSYFLYCSIYLNKNIDLAVKYFAILMIVIPIISSISANIYFGQPIILGVLSERGWLTICGSIYVFYCITKNKISVTELENTFVKISIVSLFFYILIYVFIDPNAISGDNSFGQYTEARGVRFFFQEFFIIFGTLYFFIKSYRNRAWSAVLLLFAFLFYIVFFNGGRTYILNMLVTIFFFVTFNLSLKIFAVSVVFIIPLMAFTTVSILLFGSDFLSDKFNLFLDMFKVVFTFEQGNDISSNIRLINLESIQRFIEQNFNAIYFGVGNISNHFLDGWESFFGYFYPSDIGFVGGAFLYGIFGIVCIWLIPSFVSFLYLYKTRKVNDIFIDSVRYTLIFHLLTPQQHIAYFTIFKLLLPLFILIGYSKLYYERLNKTV